MWSNGTPSEWDVRNLKLAASAMRRRWGGLYLALAVGAACVAVGTPTSELCGHSPRLDAADTARGLDLGGSRRIARGGGLPAQSARGALGNMVGKAWGSIDRVHGFIGGMHEDECEAGATMDPLRLRGGAKQPKSKKRSNSRTRSGSGAPLFPSHTYSCFAPPVPFQSLHLPCKFGLLSPYVPLALT
jgi:hypothetical protein